MAVSIFHQLFQFIICIIVLIQQPNPNFASILFNSVSILFNGCFNLSHRLFQFFSNPLIASTPPLLALIVAETPFVRLGKGVGVESRLEFCWRAEKLLLQKRNRFIGLHPAFLSAKNPIFAFIRNNAQSGISKYSSRSQ